MPRKPSSRRSFQSYQSLEPRQLLASITTFETGEVRVIGNATDDVIELVGNADFQTFTVRVNNNADLTESFAYADVTKLTVFAGDGNDRVTNTLLMDTFIYGGDGNDNLEGGFLNDLLSGGEGVDRLVGRNGDDSLNGGEGIDSLFGVNGADRLFGFAGNDRLFGGAGDDLLVGGLGNDRMVGDVGDDLLNGNEGDDSIFAGLGDDTVNGGVGEDAIFGQAGTNELNGNGDNDRIFGGTGPDRITGGSGDDRLAGGEGEDRIQGDNGADVLFGGAGTDFLSGGAGNDFVYGQAGDDRLGGDTGEDNLFGNDGNDSFFLSNNARLNGGAGVDEIVPLFSDEFNFRVDQAGSDFIVTDLRSPNTLTWSGTSTLTSIEQVNFLGGEDPIQPIESLLWNPIVERVFVQPIIVSDDDGSNTAASFGTPEQEAEIKRRVNRIYNQAGVDVVFLPTNHWNNTFANGVGEGDRDRDELDEIISRGDAAGVGSSDPLVLDYYFVTRVPNASEPVLGGGGIAFLGGNGAAQATNELFSTFEIGRERIALVLGHELGHNLGLQHDNNSPTTSLMSSDGSSVRLKDFQISQVINSRFSQPISEGGSNDTAAGISSAVAGDNGDIGGCDCGVCGLCTGGNPA